MHKLRGRKPSVVSVFLWICQHADASGRCFPSIGMLAEEACISEQTVRRSIGELCEMGILERYERYQEKRQTSNEYQIYILEGRPV